MTGFLDTLGQRLADRWLTLLVLPGALYIASAITAHTLGQAHALDLTLLTRRVTAWTRAPAATSAGGQIVLLAAVLAASATAGLAARALGRLAELVVLAPDWESWPAPLSGAVRRRVERRRYRWDTADYHGLREQAARARGLGERLDPEPRNVAFRELARIAEMRPERPTWSGDRIATAATRLRDDLEIDLARVWPSVWLSLPDSARNEITDARTALIGATTLAGWAVLYAVVGSWWWPAFVVAAMLAVAARHHVRDAADTYAQLIEAAARLHASAAIGS